jgi:hypothetical protein
VMTEITTSLEPLKNKDWDNGQPGLTSLTIKTIWDWDHLTMHTFCLLPLTLHLCKTKSHVYTRNVAEDNMSAYFIYLFPHHVLGCALNLLSLPFTLFLYLA